MKEKHRVKRIIKKLSKYPNIKDIPTSQVHFSVKVNLIDNRMHINRKCNLDIPAGVLGAAFDLP